jgi:hypothetical protein
MVDKTTPEVFLGVAKQGALVDPQYFYDAHTKRYFASEDLGGNKSGLEFRRAPTRPRGGLQNSFPIAQASVRINHTWDSATPLSASEFSCIQVSVGIRVGTRGPISSSSISKRS